MNFIKHQYKYKSGKIDKDKKQYKQKVSPTWYPTYEPQLQASYHISRYPYWYKKPLLYNIGFLYFFKRHSNIYVVLTNYFKKHLYTITAGNALLGKKKKEKLAVHNLIKLIKKVFSLLKYYKINNIEIIWKQRLSRHFYTLHNFLRKRRIYIRGYRFLLTKAHGAMKKRKLRRV